MGGAGASAALYAPPSTAKGRAIAADMQALADDYFDSPDESQVTALPPRRTAGGGSASASLSPLAKNRAYYTARALPRSWTVGPNGTSGQEGRVFDASNGNLLCMDVYMGSSGGFGAAGALCVVGSADHGLKVFDLGTTREVKNLYNKTNGHTEWVTACKFLPDGRVLSGGMDSKLCLWDSVAGGRAGGMARCRDLLGHTGSISQVDVNAEGYAVSAAYDRTLRVWDSCGSTAAVLSGHKAPVMQFDWCGTQIISGDRQGHVKVWDVETGTCRFTAASKRGQIGTVRQFFHESVGELAMFGDQGGVLTVLDLREGKRPVFQDALHPGGVVSGIRGVLPSTGGGGGGSDAPLVVTCGADRRICVLDTRMSFRPVHTFTDHTDFIYSMETFGPLVVSGGGNGWILVHDTRTGECCYGLGAGKNAIREIYATPQFMVAAGDDGDAVVYDYM